MLGEGLSIPSRPVRRAVEAARARRRRGNEAGVREESCDAGRNADAPGWNAAGTRRSQAGIRVSPPRNAGPARGNAHGARFGTRDRLRRDAVN